jgi:hypothetical protein
MIDEPERRSAGLVDGARLFLTHRDAGFHVSFNRLATASSSSISQNEELC